MLADFSTILLFISLGIAFVFITMLVARLIRPHRPNAQKLSTYECGEEPIGSARVQFNNRFYVIALMFLIFEVEVILLFLWAVVFQDIGWYNFFAMSVFVFLIFIGFIYELGSGNIEWDKPAPVQPEYKKGVGVIEPEEAEVA